MISLLAARGCNISQIARKVKSTKWRNAMSERVILECGPNKYEGLYEGTWSNQDGNWQGQFTSTNANIPCSEGIILHRLIGDFGQKASCEIVGKMEGGQYRISGKGPLNPPIPP